MRKSVAMETMIEWLDIANLPREVPVGSRFTKSLI